MRFKLIDRILLVVLLIAFLALSVGAIAFGLLLFPEERVKQTVEYVYVYWPNSAMIIGVSLVALIIILRIFYVTCSSGGRRAPASVVISHDDGGSVNVTVSTLSAIVERTVAGTEGVKSCRNSILPKEEGMNIALRVTLNEDVPIPEKTAEIQAKLKESVQRLTGLAVAQVHVMVDQTPAKKTDAQ